jgi:hypothetical protein
MAETVAVSEVTRKRQGRRVLVFFFAICAAPIIASYLSYYVIKPSARTNYGTLIEPQRPVPLLQLQTLEGKPFDLSSLSGKWVMLSADGGKCGVPCATKLYEMRQLRLITGKDQERIERVWFITDNAPVDQAVLLAYPGTLMVRADAAALAAWLPAQDAIADHLYLVDPHQHLMMQFPRDPDPYQVKRDLTHLLAASEIG